VAALLGAPARPLDEVLAELRRDLALPTSLGAAGIPRSNLGELARLAMLDACHLGNPVSCDVATFERLFEAAF
jgi:alcohol dehydrogenase class IV